MAITAAQARQELAKRELTRRGKATHTTAEPDPILKFNADHPYLAATEKSVNDLTVPMNHFANQLSMGNLKSVSDKMGGRTKLLNTKTDNKAVDVVAHGAGVAGYFANPVNRMTGLGMLRGKALQTAGAGALQGLITAPADEGVFSNRVANAAVGGVVGSVGGALGNVGQGAKDLLQGAKFSDDLVAGVRRYKQAAVNKFGDGLETLAKANPFKTVSLTNLTNRLNSNNFGPESRDLQIMINKSPKLKELLDNPKLAEQVPLSRVQEIINEYKANLPSKLRRGTAVDVNDFEILDTLDDIKAAQLEAFPEMAQVRQAYSEAVRPYEMVRNKLREQSIYNQTLRKYGDPVSERAAKKIFKDVGMEERVRNARRAAVAGKGAKWAGGIGLGILATKHIADRVGGGSN